MTETTIFARALETTPGVGNVTAGRLLAHFATYDELLACPREQVFFRIKGAPGAEALVAHLFDRPEMQNRLTGARQELEALAKQHIQVLSAADSHWPGGLTALPRASRPILLYAYGQAEILTRPSVAVLARPPIDGPAFEQAQDLVRHLASHRVTLAAGIAHGFDVAVHRLSVEAPEPAPSIMVANAGLARLSKSLRPAVLHTVRAGGVFVSPFPLQHGPFEHDDRKRALVQVALAQAAVFVQPVRDTPEWQAMAYLIESGRPVFAIGSGDETWSDRIHPIRSSIDFDWVVAARTA